MKKPELLLPAGNIEAFFAALEGGADAVYLGLRNFNARDRAKNFTLNQLQSLLKESEKQNKKVYLTLNTLIKNNELSQLLDTLYLLSQTTISAIIIQDLGVYYLLKKHFPKILLHASTQMGFHNSVGANFAEKLKFERVILARELTFEELVKIKKKSNIELETFIHGALCYSFSGMCLFSSYLGGMSANRGKCRQPCRRIYQNNEKGKYFFSLKDIQLIEQVPKIMEIGISSLKIEGRMKSAEYVYRVAKAYRMAIDNPHKIEEAKQILQYDFGREKTTYFFGQCVKNAITENPFIGIHLGNISKISKNKFTFPNHHSLKIRDRIRVQTQDGMNTNAIKIKELHHIEKNTTVIYENHNFTINDKVFLIGLSEKKFKNKFSQDGKHLQTQMPKRQKQNILAQIGSMKTPKIFTIYARIDSLKWLRKIYFDNINYLILNLPKKEWADFDLQNPFLQKQIAKLVLQLPKFISENNIGFYKSLCLLFYKNGVNKFMISHISQLEILPKRNNITILASENIYSLNDAAIQFLKENNVDSYIYPLENDAENLQKGKDRKGIVPLYFHPELFYSRMPSEAESPFSDKDYDYEKVVKNSITRVISTLPTSLLQYKDSYYKVGFRNFLLDFSFEKPSQKRFNRILKKFHNSTAEQPSSNFNFKNGLN